MEMDIELVKSAFRYAEQGDLDGLAGMLTEDFQFTGATPEPMNKAQFVDLVRRLTNAIPDWKFNLSNLSEAAGTVRMVSRITGANTGTFDLPMLGLNLLPPTGRKLALPPETTDVVVSNGKLASLNVTPSPGGGVMGILNQLGIRVPTGAGVR